MDEDDSDEAVVEPATSFVAEESLETRVARSKHGGARRTSKPTARRGRPRKESLQYGQSKEARLRGRYTKPYLDLLNSAINDAANRAELEDQDPLDPSQIGACLWSSSEKHRFFQALSVLGKDDTLGIARAITTKSETEVHDYLLLLKEANLECAFTTDRNADFAHEDAPAALEISEECEYNLDLAAEDLAWQAEKWEQKRETTRHGKFWLLTDQVAKELEQQSVGEALETDDTRSSDVDGTLSPSSAADEEDDSLAGKESSLLDQDGEVDDRGSTPMTAAELLHLPNWIELSYLFMSGSKNGKGGWQSLVENEVEGPAIYHTAFSDFHNLAVSLTKRLLQATLFQTTSRLRASDRYNPEPLIRHQDVQAAVRVLGIEVDWHEFWVGCARRNNLEVYTRPGPKDDDQKGRWGRYMPTYDEIESALRKQHAQYIESEFEVPESPQPDIVQSVEDEIDDDIYDNSDFWTDTSSIDSGNAKQISTFDDSTSSRDSSASPARSASPPRQHVRRDQSTQIARAEDDYLEALDAQASRAEEARLWSIMQRSPVDPVKIEEDVDKPVLPRRKRKRMPEMRDWRVDLEIDAEWEMYGIADEQEFQDVAAAGVLGRKRRKEAYARIAAHKDEDNHGLGGGRHSKDPPPERSEDRNRSGGRSDSDVRYEEDDEEHYSNEDEDVEEIEQDADGDGTEPDEQDDEAGTKTVQRNNEEE